MAIYTFGVLLVASGASMGYLAGKNYGSPGKITGLCVLGSASCAAFFALERRREKTAIIEIQNKLASMEDPSLIDRQLVKSVSKKYGFDITSRQNAKLRPIYEAYLAKMIPIGGQVKEKDIELIKAFKEYLGINDTNAAEAHIDLGRNINRLKSEVDSHRRAAEISKTFQKLIYISDQVFGYEKSKSLLPWKRHFGLNDAKLFLARKEFAKQLFSDRLVKSSKAGLHFNKEVLEEMYTYCDVINLRKEYAVDIINKLTRSTVIAKLSEVLSKNNTTKYNEKSSNVSVLEWVFEYNAFFSTQSRVKNPFSGIKPIRLNDNSEPGIDKKAIEDLYRAFLEQHLKNCELSTLTELKCQQLQLVLGINRKDSSSILRSEINKAYRMALRKTYESYSKNRTNAISLKKLCTSLNLNPKAALEINKSILKQRFEQLVEKGSITTAEEIELNNLRLYLCIKKNEYNDLKNELCGRPYRHTIGETFKKGLYSSETNIQENIRNTALKLRIDNDMAIAHLDLEVRKILMQFIATHRSKTSRVESSKELRNMVLFYNHSVSPILTTITKNVKSNQYPKIKTDFEVKTFNRENNVKTTTKNIQGHVTKKEIVLSEDIELKDRLNLYKKFLHYCVTGNVIELGLGSVITLEHEQKEFSYLKQLGTILGLNQLEISEVHQSMAESAFKMQAQSILTESNLSKEKNGANRRFKKKTGNI
jgi:hypothetical protein